MLPLEVEEGFVLGPCTYYNGGWTMKKSMIIALVLLGASYCSNNFAVRVLGFGERSGEKKGADLTQSVAEARALLATSQAKKKKQSLVIFNDLLEKIKTYLNEKTSDKKASSILQDIKKRLSALSAIDSGSELSEGDSIDYKDILWNHNQ